MESVAASLEARHPETNRNRRVRMAFLRDHLSGGVRRALWILMAAVGFLLAIACANIGGLLLSRAETRRGEREIGTRIALGARPADVVRMIARSGLPAILAGGLVGLGGAVAVSRGLAALLFGVSPLDA